MIFQNGRVSIAGILLFSALAGVALAQNAGVAPPPNIDPEAIVTRAANNELATGGDPHPYRYTLRKVDDGKITTKEIIETKDGDVARLIAFGDKPLTPDAEEAEIDRLKNLLADPSIQEHRRKREQADENRANEMLRLLPHAFLYQFEGMVDGPDGPCYRLSLKPNPNFTPPDREAEVYHGMAGELWIDQKRERMVKLDVHLIDDVEFGWGIVGRLYKGGTILVEQKDVGDDHWEQNVMRLRLSGKILLIKSLTMDTNEEESDFSPVPANWGYQDAVRTFLSENK